MSSAPDTFFVGFMTGSHLGFTKHLFWLFSRIVGVPSNTFSCLLSQSCDILQILLLTLVSCMLFIHLYHKFPFVPLKLHTIYTFVFNCLTKYLLLVMQLVFFQCWKILRYYCISDWVEDQQILGRKMKRRIVPLNCSPLSRLNTKFKSSVFSVKII